MPEIREVTLMQKIIPPILANDPRITSNRYFDFLFTEIRSLIDFSLYVSLSEQITYFRVKAIPLNRVKTCGLMW